MQKKIFEILLPTALTVGLIWTVLELTPKSALLSLTILYLKLVSLSIMVSTRATTRGKTGKTIVLPGFCRIGGRGCTLFVLPSLWRSCLPKVYCGGPE